MKKAMFILSTVLLFGILSSCSTDELTVKKNWIFTVTLVTTMSPDPVGLGAVTTSYTEEKDNLTEVEAEAYAKGQAVALTQSNLNDGITISVTATVTKAEKK